MFRKTIYILVLILMLYGTAFSDKTQIGTTSNNFLKIMAPAKPAAMAESYFALADDINSIQYNPAGIGKAMISEISFTHIEWFQDIKYENLNIMFPLMTGNLAISFDMMHMTPMQKTIEDAASAEGYTVEGEFSPGAMYGTLAYGMEFSDNFFIGANLKILNYSINPEDSSGSALSFMIDSGLIFDLESLPGLSFAISFKNVGPGTTFLDETSLQPFNILGGIGYEGNFFGLEADVEYFSDNDINYSVGGYFTLFDIVSLRAGFKGGTIPRPTFGGGLNYNNFGLDYAFIPYNEDELGLTHRITASYKFGSPDVSLRVNPVAFSPNRDKVYDYTFLIPQIKSRAKAKNITVTIYDSLQQPIKSVTVSGANKKLFWNGTNDFRTVVPDGQYFAGISVDYGGGIKSSSNLASVEVDNTPPDIMIDAKPKLVKPGQMDTLVVPVSFMPSLYDPHGIGTWKLVITKPNGTIFKTMRGTGNPGRVVWDGSSDNGVDEIQTGASYGYTFYASDRLGNWGRSSTKKVKILLREVKITLSADTLFDPGKADVKISIYKELQEISKQIKSYNNIKVLVEGHTDNIPMRSGTYANNQDLSQYRAEAVVEFFVKLFGIDRDIFTAVGKGDSQPVADNSTAEGRKKNRRVTLRIQASYWE